jgi:hypothetical protein
MAPLSKFALLLPVGSSLPPASFAASNSGYRWIYDTSNDAQRELAYIYTRTHTLREHWDTINTHHRAHNLAIELLEAALGDLLHGFPLSFLSRLARLQAAKTYFLHV